MGAGKNLYPFPSNFNPPCGSLRRNGTLFRCGSLTNFGTLRLPARSVHTVLSGCAARSSSTVLSVGSAHYALLGTLGPHGSLRDHGNSHVIRLARRLGYSRQMRLAPFVPVLSSLTARSPSTVLSPAPARSPFSVLTRVAARSPFSALSTRSARSPFRYSPCSGSLRSIGSLSETARSPLRYSPADRLDLYTSSSISSRIFFTALLVQYSQTSCPGCNGLAIVS